MRICSSYNAVPPYITKDGSIVRELMHPAVHGNRAQSLAEATVPQGGKTRLHQHLKTEEIYHFTAGSGLMELGDERFSVNEGDTICIPPGTLHAVKNTGSVELRILCACCPPYSHEDTELVVTV
ncbi:MAG TPA: cupin domain-containing protein [Dissulfurispiraceae bacterium]|nr:cupin domain-containing protein [Dissulfurispiraceae bacterium]